MEGTCKLHGRVNPISCVLIRIIQQFLGFPPFQETSLKGGVSMENEGPPSGDFHIIASTHGSLHGSQRGEGSRHLNASNRGDCRLHHGESDGSKHLNRSSRGVEGSQTLVDIKEV